MCPNFLKIGEIMPKVRYDSSKGLVIEPGSGVSLGQLSLYPNGNGTALANSAAAVEITGADTGKVFISNLAGNHTKVVTLSSSSPVGTRIKIIQNADPAHNGCTLRLDCKPDAYIVGSNCLAPVDGGGAVSASGDNRLTISKHSANAKFGKGSTIDIVKVSAGLWRVEVVGALQGTGAGGSFAFSSY
jgi:hypothetical protein